MNKLKKYTNQELLTEIDQRIPDFTPADLMELMKLPGRHRQQIEAFFQIISPEFSQWYQEKMEEAKELRKRDNWKINFKN